MIETGSPYRQFRDAEVEKLDDVEFVAAAHQEEIRWLDVTVHGADGMGGRERLAGLYHVVAGSLERQPSLFAEQRAEVLALQIFHDDEGRAVGHRSDVED